MNYALLIKPDVTFSEFARAVTEGEKVFAAPFVRAMTLQDGAIVFMFDERSQAEVN
jgi:hypothetical protein